jgi:hypothetical protein
MKRQEKELQVKAEVLHMMKEDYKQQMKRRENVLYVRWKSISRWRKKERLITNKEDMSFDIQKGYS